MNNERQEYSFAAIIAACIFAYIAFKFLPVVQFADNAYVYLNSTEGSSNVIISYLNLATGGEFTDTTNFLYFWFWAILISYLIKTILSLMHVFSPSKKLIFAIAISAIVLEILPITIKIWQLSNEEDAFKAFILMYLPTLFCFAIIWVFDMKKNYLIEDD